jgi:hypothetical protein
MNRVLFYIRRMLKHCYSCGTKIREAEINPYHPSNGGIAGIRGWGWGYVCIPCMLEGYKEKEQ